MAFPKYIHDPDAVLDYSVDWSLWMPTGDLLTTADVTAETGVTVDSTVVDGSVVTAWISGGTAGESYDCTFHIVTADGREDDRSITLQCKER